MKKSLNIICAGSSITWTDGLISGFVGGLDREIRQRGGHILPHQLQSRGGSEFRHFKLFDQAGLMLSGVGSSLEFDFAGDTLFLCQLIRRTAGYAEVEVTADGVVVDRFDNRNPTLGLAAKSFAADGAETKFPLGRPFTYAHKVYVDGQLKQGRISSHDYDEMNFGGNDYLVMRSLSEAGQVEHVLCFPVPPPANSRIEVEFSYGESIGYMACTVGENEQGEMESIYGFAGPKPNYGLDFRYTNPAAFRRIGLPKAETQRIRLEITGGEQPYFVFNFAANRMVNIMSAGIGGWKLNFFQDDGRGRNIDKALSLLAPDVMFLEYSANDDWHYFQRKTQSDPVAMNESQILELPLLELYEVKDHRVRYCAAPILELTPTSLRCASMRAVEVGDIARIGREIREVSGVESDRIHWNEPLTETTASEVTIRSLKEYKNRFRRLITRIRNEFPLVTLFLTAPAPANYGRRQLWGYDITLRQLAAEFTDCRVIEMKKYFASFQPSDWVEHEFVTDGRQEYELPWSGYSQYFSLTPEYEFTVQCTDQFVLNGYHEFSLDEPVDTDPRMKFWMMNDPQPMRLIFASAPPAGIRFKIRYSPQGWSHDYCHPNPAGCRIYVAAYTDSMAH